MRRVEREIGKLLRQYGFGGSGNSWVRVESSGVASVGRSRAISTWSGGQQSVGFGLALSVTPIEWWEFSNWRDAGFGRPPTPLERAEGPRLVDHQGLPDQVMRPWSIGVDPALQPERHALQADIDVVRAELPSRVHAYARRALRLLQPGRYLEELLAQPGESPGRWETIAVLLSAEGPGPQLDDACDRAQASAAACGNPEYGDLIVTYCRLRAVGG